MTAPAYDTYRDSGIDWLGKVPSHWGVSPLKTPYAIFGGATPKSEREDYWDGGVPWVTPADLSRLTSPFIGETLRTISETGLASCAASLVPADSVILSTRAPIGSIGITTASATTNQGCKALVSRGGAVSSFLAYTLSIATEQLRVRGKGTTFLELSGDELGRFKVPTPPSAEQAAIAAFLDRETGKIDALVEAQTRLIELLKEKRQAVISHAVTKGLNPAAPMKDSGVEWLGRIPAHWGQVPLRRVVRQFVDYRGVTPQKRSEGVPLITATQIKNGRINHNLDPVFISEDEYVERMTRGFPARGDLLLTTEAPLGEVALVEDERIAPGQRMILMKMCESVMTSHYLHAHFCSDFGQSELWTRASGSTASGIRADRLRSSAVLVPPLNEQRLIVEHIERETKAFEQLLSVAGTTITLLQERRSALISAAVTGKIDVRGLVPQQAEAA